MELNNPKADFGGESLDLFRGTINEESNGLACRRERGDDFRGMIRINTTGRDGMEIQSDPVRPKVSAPARLVDVS